MKKILIIAMLIILSVVSYSKNKSYDEVPIEKNIQNERFEKRMYE